MASIKWISPRHYAKFGVCEPGQIVTLAQISRAVMTKWVSQGLAEWVLEPIEEPIEDPIELVVKKNKRKRRA